MRRKNGGRGGEGRGRLHTFIELLVGEKWPWQHNFTWSTSHGRKAMFWCYFSLAVLSLASNDRRPCDAYLCVLIVVHSLCHLCYVGQQIASI